jgi:hypothetical protein
VDVMFVFHAALVCVDSARVANRLCLDFHGM